MTIHLQNIAMSAAFLKCGNWMRLCVISSWLGYLLDMQETKAPCFMGLKILKSQFRTYQCRIFVSDYIMGGGRKTLLTMPVCKMSTEQEKNPKNTGSKAKFRALSCVSVQLEDKKELWGCCLPIYYHKNRKRFWFLALGYLLNGVLHSTWVTLPLHPSIFAYWNIQDCVLSRAAAKLEYI